MKRKLFGIAALVICVLMLTFSTGVLADFGGFSGDSDYGGDFDLGGSDSDFGLGDGLGWLLWGGLSSSSDSDDGRGGGCGGIPTIVIIIIIVVVVMFILRSKKSSGGGIPVQTSVKPTEASELRPISEYTANEDPGFSSADMQTKLANLYVQLQDCWSAKDITPLRPYLTDELYNQSERQLEEIKRANQTPHIERISVLGVNIRGWCRRDGMDHMIVEMSTRITTFTTDDSTGNIVRGDRNAEKFMTYEWDVARTTGVTTAAAAEMKTVNCPNCGAPVTINKSAKCPYCETVITLDEHDWVLFSIKGLSQRTQ